MKLSLNGECSIKNFKHKTKMFTNLEQDEITISFEDGSYDYDQIDSVFDIYKGVKSSLVFTCSLVGKKEQIIKAIETIQNNVRLIDTTYLQKNVAKNLAKFLDDITLCYIHFSKE